MITYVLYNFIVIKKEEELTVKINNHILGFLVANPVTRAPVPFQMDDLGLEMLSSRERFVVVTRRRGEISVTLG